MLWETVIGIEIHVQLNTRTKLFSQAPNRFGNEPNTNISVVCTGQPGALPVLNKEAVKKAVQFGCAIQAEVALESHFDRKSYFYPDSPRNFQITQYDEPIVRGGSVTTTMDDQEVTFAINRAHLEDDSGMLKHFTGFAGIDYNRAGCALIEIVSEACMHSAKEAVAYASALRHILLYLDVSDCNMEEGSFRMDVNVSVRPQGETTLRNRVEIKNINSFVHMQMAIEEQVAEQIKTYVQNGVVQRSTFRFCTEAKKTVLMRDKEDAEDYRYFREPDLPPLRLTQGYIESIRKELPELPRAKKKRFMEELQIPEHFVETLLSDRPLCLYFEEALSLSKGINPKTLLIWIVVEFTGRLKDQGKHVSTYIPTKHVAELVTLLEKGTITGKIAKAVADEMIQDPSKTPSSIIASNPEYKPMEDKGAIEAIVDEVLKNNPQSILDFKSGRDKAFAFLVGQVMKATKGTASPAYVNELLKNKML